MDMQHEVFKKISLLAHPSSYFISSVLKLTIVEMKFSLIVTERIVRHSVVFSPRRRQIDSRATLTTAGGFAIERTSTRCCFFIDFTATEFQKAQIKGGTMNWSITEDYCLLECDAVWSGRSLLMFQKSVLCSSSWKPWSIGNDLLDYMVLHPWRL